MRVIHLSCVLLTACAAGDGSVSSEMLDDFEATTSVSVTPSTASGFVLSDLLDETTPESTGLESTAGAGSRSSPATPAAVPSSAGSAAAPSETPSPMVRMDAATAPDAPSEDECELHEIRARQDGGDQPYQIAADFGDAYRCFVFDLKLEGPTQGLAFYPMTDNTKVVHHFMLYRHDAIDTSKSEIDCDSLSADAVVIAGWAPGSGDWVLPKDVGIDLGPGRFVLEMHYSNFANEATNDRSGMQICATHELRPHTATVSWLGNQFFAIPPHTTDYQVQGRCTPTSKQQIHVLRSWPHMHMHGQRMTVRLDRADGMRATVLDEPFSFGNQKQYDTPLVLNPGDSLLTTCYYDNPNDSFVGIGLKTTDEMCHNFVVAYPAGALASPGQLTSSCLGLP